LLGLLYPAGIYQQFIEDEINNNDNKMYVYLKYNGSSTPYIMYYNGSCGSNYVSMQNVYSKKWYSITLNGCNTFLKFYGDDGFSGEFYLISNSVWFENVKAGVFNANGRPIDSIYLNNTNLNLYFKKPSGWSQNVWISYNEMSTPTAMDSRSDDWYSHTFYRNDSYKLYDGNDTNYYIVAMSAIIHGLS
jgi:hypothetical protein